MNIPVDTIAVKISSHVLNETLLEDPELWLIFDERKFKREDKLPWYFPDEIPLLKDKTREQLIKIDKAKRVFLGSRVKA